MGLHTNTVFKNSCLKVPLNPSSRLPSAKYERNTLKSSLNRKKPADSVSINTEDENKNQISFREFYKSIPDYEEVNHLSNQEFYLKLESLRENKNELLLKCGRPINVSEKYSEDKEIENKTENIEINYSPFKSNAVKNKSNYNYDMRQRDSFNGAIDRSNNTKDYAGFTNKYENSSHHRDTLNCKNDYFDTKFSNANYNHDIKSRDTTDADSFAPWVQENWSPQAYRDDTNINFQTYRKVDNSLSKRSFSVPTSPVKKSPKFDLSSNHLTSPCKFKMTERDEEKQMLDQLREYSNDLEYKILQNKKENRRFRANPVPIESRIPLFDKIMEDQELRRSISKLQSTAELQAQMKPFKFTEREERGGDLSNFRLCRSNPQLNLPSPGGSDAQTNTKFKAKPVPKNLFSNYIYEKMREDDFYRALNRRIRAEEMLKAASLPPSMAKRERCKKDYSPVFLGKTDQASDTISSQSSGSEKRKRRSKHKRTRRDSSRHEKINREYEELKKEFISSGSRGSPSKSNKNIQGDLLKKLYSSQASLNPSPCYQHRSQSAFEGPSVNRSNLAAILRIESTKKKMEADIMKILEEERFQSEVKWRDSVLRRKPAWNTLKYSHSGDLAMRLQTRKDEERLLREQFLHDMECMYGRVHQQPLMFERTYGPRRHFPRRESMVPQDDSYRQAKPRSALINRELTPNVSSPNRSRKVSINETAETIGDDIEDLLYKNSDDEKESKSSDDIPESIANDYNIEDE